MYKYIYIHTHTTPSCFPASDLPFRSRSMSSWALWRFQTAEFWGAVLCVLEKCCVPCRVVFFVNLVLYYMKLYVLCCTVFHVFFPNALDSPAKVEVHRPPRITTPSPGVALGEPSFGWTKRCKRWINRYTSVSIDDEFLETSWNIPEGRIVDSGLFFLFENFHNISSCMTSSPYILGMDHLMLKKFSISKGGLKKGAFWWCILVDRNYTLYTKRILTKFFSSRFFLPQVARWYHGGTKRFYSFLAVGSQLF